MSFTDYHLEERLMDLRVQEERRKAELRPPARGTESPSMLAAPGTLLAPVPVGQSLRVVGRAVAG